jgi:hypothetical protein
MIGKTTIYSVAALYMCGTFVRHGLYMSALLLALPLDVPSTAETRGQTQVEQRFCGRNPHTCMAVSELGKELQLRTVALQQAVTALVEAAEVSAVSTPAAPKTGNPQALEPPPLLEPIRPAPQSS